MENYKGKKKRPCSCGATRAFMLDEGMQLTTNSR